LPTWRIPAEKMKMKREHLVPLSRQSIEVIEAARQISGDAPYVFPNARWFSKPMTENAIGYLYDRVGFHGKHVPHGWPSLACCFMRTRRG
jgi:integrase